MLIRGWLRHRVDHQNFYGTAGPFEFEPKLLLKRVEDRREVRCRSGTPARFWGKCSIRTKIHEVVPLAVKVSPVNNGRVDIFGDNAGEAGDGVTAAAKTSRSCDHGWTLRCRPRWITITA